MKEQSRELSTIDGRNVNGQARRYPNTPTLPADAVELERRLKGFQNLISISLSSNHLPFYRFRIQKLCQGFPAYKAQIRDLSIITF